LVKISSEGENPMLVTFCALLNCNCEGERIIDEEILKFYCKTDLKASEKIV
jgi:hypothetical protein